MFSIKKIITCLVCLFPLFKIKNLILNYLGHSVSYNSKIGFSIILVDKLIINDRSVIKNFNLIRIKKLHLKDETYIGNFNFFRGNFNLRLFSSSTIKNFNLFTRGDVFNDVSKSNLVLGQYSQISSMCTLDLADSILISSDSILAGKSIQLWTHGFFHTDDKKRNLIIGKIKIFSNVYISSRVVINPGITISKNINVGINLAVTQDLKESGIYFSNKPNIVKYQFDPNKFKVSKIKNFSVFQKKK